MSLDADAVVRRNRRPTGRHAVRFEARISEEAIAALDAARRASGNLSVGLYLELLTKALVQEHGALPVLSPTLDIEESHVTAA